MKLAKEFLALMSAVVIFATASTLDVFYLNLPVEFKNNLMNWTFMANFSFLFFTGFFFVLALYNREKIQENLDTDLTRILLYFLLFIGLIIIMNLVFGPAYTYQEYSYEQLAVHLGVCIASGLSAGWLYEGFDPKKFFGNDDEDIKM